MHYILIYGWQQAVNNLPSVNNQINAKLGHLSSNGKICVNGILVESLAQSQEFDKWFLCGNDTFCVSFASYILNCFIVLNMKSKVFPHEGTLGSQKIWVLFKCKKLPDSLKQRNFWQSCPIFKKIFYNYFLFNSLRRKRNDKELLFMYFVSYKVQRKENVDGSILF